MKLYALLIAIANAPVDGQGYGPMISNIGDPSIIIMRQMVDNPDGYKRVLIIPMDVTNCQRLSNELEEATELFANCGKVTE